MYDDFELVDEFDAAHSSEEDSWGSTNKSDLSDEDDFVLAEREQVPAGWLGVKNPIMVKSESNESWDRISLISLSAASECSLNNVANEIIERSAISYDKKITTEEEPEPTEEIKKKKKKKKKKKQKVVCGLILFRNNGAEVALINVVNFGLSLVNNRMRKGEEPLETAIRAFRENTGLISEQKIALLPHVIQKWSDSGRKLNLMFPAITARKLEFVKEKKEYDIEWWPSDIVAKGNKKLAKIISLCVRDAMDLLHRHADELPTLVNDEISEMSEMASMTLFEYAQEQKKGVTIQEVRDFLCRNQDDLKTLVAGCGNDEIKKMLRKLILQMPGNSGIPDSVPAANVNEIVQPPSEVAHVMLSLLEVARNKKGRVSWSKLADLLEESPEILTDDRVLSILVSCGYLAGKQKFGKKHKGGREEILTGMLKSIC